MRVSSALGRLVEEHVDEDELGAAPTQVLVRIGDRQLHLTDEGAELVGELLRLGASGQGVVMSALDEELSPDEAGEVLGVSRHVVRRLVDQGVLPAREVERVRGQGKTRPRLRIPAAAVHLYRAMRYSDAVAGPTAEELERLAASVPADARIEMAAVEPTEADRQRTADLLEALEVGDR